MSFPGFPDGNIQGQNGITWMTSQTDERNVAIQTGGRGGEELVMVGVQINKAILIRRQPNWFHTRWNISHTEPEFDKTFRKNFSQNSSASYLAGNFIKTTGIPACTKEREFFNKKGEESG